MYTLLSGLYKHLTQHDEYCVVILGLDNAGKTTYLEAAKANLDKNYKRGDPKRVTATVGLNVGKIDTAGITIQFWDLGGQTELQSLWDKYYEECHGIIYVIDSYDRERIEESKEAFDKMVRNELLSKVPLLVLANKQDLPECMGVREVKPIFNQSAHLIGSRDCMVMPVSALTGEGISEGINWLIDCLKRNSDIRPPKSSDS
ncbi:ADP-ribosylation factor-related protein 1 [Folsomia candida]|uniref:ADP-ribosylation factor-related protein 1 n=1 Tax=Folsomia candida TaxID=158441 RepID=UPI000B904672|nr:ADP-ribosylation factor-related protein 1 [Folsomia candida]